MCFLQSEVSYTHSLGNSSQDSLNKLVPLEKLVAEHATVLGLILR